MRAPKIGQSLAFVFSHFLLARGHKTHARPNPTANALSHKLSPHCSLTTFHSLRHASVQVRASAPQMFDVSPWKNIWNFDAQKACFDAWDPEKPRSYTNFNPFERNGAPPRRELGSDAEGEGEARRPRQVAQVGPQGQARLLLDEVADRPWRAALSERSLGWELTPA